MDKLFSADSTLMRGLTSLADVMILNLLFLVTSIPLVTLGASLTALNFTAMRISSGECVSVSADYFRSFRRNFRQATLIGLLLTLVIGALAAWYVVLTAMVGDALTQFVLLAAWWVLAFSVATTTIFVFPYLASFEGSTREVFRNAWLLSWRHPLTALAALTVILLSTIVTVFYPQATGYGLLWLAGGFSGVSLVNGRLVAGVFNKYVAAAALAQR